MRSPLIWCVKKYYEFLNNIFVDWINNVTLLLENSTGKIRITRVIQQLGWGMFNLIDSWSCQGYDWCRKIWYSHFLNIFYARDWSDRETQFNYLVAEKLMILAHALITSQLYMYLMGILKDIRNLTMVDIVPKPLSAWLSINM